MKVPFSNKIATKMLTAFFVVILIPATLGSVFISYFASSLIKTNVRQSTLQVAERAADSLLSAFLVASDISDQIYSDTRIQQAVLEGRSAQGLPPGSELDEYVETTINNIIYSSSFVKIIYIIQEEGESWGSGTFNPAKLLQYDLDELDWVKEARYKDGEYVWLPLQYDQFSGGGDNTALVLPVVRVLKRFDDMEQIGLVSVSLDGKALVDILAHLELGRTGRFFVADAEGRVVIDPDLSRIGETVPNRELYENIVTGREAEFEFAMQGVAHYGVKQPLVGGWTMVGIVPVEEITGQLAALQRRIVYSSFFFGLLAIVVALLMARRITRPIQSLAEQMKQVAGGDLRARTRIVSADEVGMLSKQFNGMIQRIEALVSEVRKEQAEKQEAELRAVMHRINPHFLFNTLSNIRWLVKFKQTERADQGISALIRLLEANMGKKGNFITVEEELDIIEKFLVILEIRYDLRFELRVTVEPSLRTFLLPRMLLQPIVENSIFHGIVPQGTNGLIDVDVSRDGDAVRIVVRDNGRGMERETAARLANMEAAATGGEVGIGIKHVYESMRLYYSPRSTFELRELQEGGTAATLVLAPREEADGDA
ncbi:sensor histidine kinase [Paenibacillus antri]|uniref:Sensor histidine kinase n=1 Tax=Paenibacillus antri TaxID=2582848 RepID=A0A5R9GCQ4_9BACL|nr:sensor histidine kinase [Paenibacillus antri]TLS50934.1 sensor histidine kinase [Paenibacillus antri]